MPKFLDLFAGAGGLSEGFIQAGYAPIAHVEMDVAACYTLKTRVAFHWLKANGNLEVYHQYLRGEIKRDEFYAHIPENVLNSVLVGVSGFEPEASWSRRLVGYFSRTFQGISAPFRSGYFTAVSFPIRIIPPVFSAFGSRFGSRQKASGAETAPL